MTPRVPRPGPYAGRSGRRWRTLRENLKVQRLPCWLCQQPIDYGLPASHPLSFCVDHAKSRRDRPDLAEDPSNLRPAHRRCNEAKGAGTPRPGLGDTSTRW